MSQSSGDEPSLGGQNDDFAASVGLGGERAILHLIAMLKDDSDQRARFRAFQLLKEIGGDLVVQKLIDILPTTTDLNIQGNIIDFFSKVGGESALLAVLSLQHSTDFHTREIVAHSLMSWPNDQRATDVLIGFLDDTAQGVRAVAIHSLSQIGGASALEAFLSHLNEPDWNILSYIVIGLGQWVHLPHVFDIVCGFLSNPQLIVRSAAVAALADARTEDALDQILSLRAESDLYRPVATALANWPHDPRVIEPLFDLLANAESLRVADAAGSSLAATHDADVFQRLVECFSSPDFYQRCGAITALGPFGGPEITSLLIEALNDPVSYVRSAAADNLGISGDETVVPYLIEALDDQDRYAHLSVVRALKRMGDPRALEPLSRYLARLEGIQDASDAIDYFEAMLASGDAIPYFIETLHRHPNENVRSGAAAVLTVGQRGHPETQIISALTTALSDPDDIVRSNAVRSLRVIATPEALAALAAWEAAQRASEA
jgi:HEAT repeat protein